MPVPSPTPALRTACAGASANSLQVGGEVSNIFGREAFGDGLHDAVWPGRSSARGVVVQLLHDVARLLTAQRRKFCRCIAAAGRAMTGHARRNSAGLIAAPIHSFAGF